MKQVSEVALALRVVGRANTLTVFPIPLLDDKLLGVETGRDGEGSNDDALSNRHGMKGM